MKQCKDIGLEIWKLIEFNGSFYENHFEEWYEDCFPSCMEDAIKSIDSGCCTFENGSFIELSKNITKDKQPHVIDFDKENLIEFYGEDQCFKMYQTIKNIEDDLIKFIANTLNLDFTYYNKEQQKLFSSAKKEWDSIKDDVLKKPIKEQEDQLDSILEDYAEKIFNLM